MEVSVSILISAVVLFFATGIILSASNLFFANRERSEEKQLGDAVFNYIVQELTYSSFIKIFPDEKAAYDYGDIGDRSVTVTDGCLYSLGENVFGDDMYMGRTVQFTALMLTEKFYYITLSVSVLDKDGQVVYTTESTVDVLNMRLSQTDILDLADGTLNPYITYNRQGDNSP